MSKRKISKRWLLLAVPATAAMVPMAAGAATTPRVVHAYHDSLRPVGANPPARATATLIRNGDTLQVTVVATGLSPNLPHVMHIHGAVQAHNECPGLEVDVNHDHLIDTLEGLPAYGGIDTTFTTSGGTSGGLAPDALDLSRAPVANRGGVLVFRRTLPVRDQVGPGEVGIARAVADDLSQLHIVIHGADLNHNGAYDFGPGVSSLSALVGFNVPLEAELPVACGPIQG